MTAHVTTVAVGRPRTVPGPRDGETTSTSIWKEPVDGPVRVLADHLDGDEQADPEHHGGVDKAVYAYGTDDLAWWGLEDDPLVFGQNLTVAGLDLRAAVVGEQWHVGSAVLEVAQPRIPCFKLGLRAGDRGMPRRFVAAGRPGVYLRVRTHGTLRAGDRVAVVDRPAHGMTVAEVFGIHHGTREGAARLLDVPGLPAVYVDRARRRTPR